VSEQRRRDSARSRQALLDAAATLFSERGFDRTTVREIGERATVDPALIARYFGGKAGLYVETLRASTEAGVPDRGSAGQGPTGRSRALAPGGRPPA